jgi:hypothetical protein
MHFCSSEIDCRSVTRCQVATQSLQVAETRVRGCARTYLVACHGLYPPTPPTISPPSFLFPRRPLKSHFSGRETSNCQIGGRGDAEKGQCKLEPEPSFYTAFSNGPFSPSAAHFAINSHHSEKFILYVFQCQRALSSLLYS